MGFINLLKNGYRGKLGETVGQKWKNQLTVRTYQSTNNSKSEAQIDQREHYKTLISSASTAWRSASNIKAPRGKSMSDFNYYTSIYEKFLSLRPATGAFYILDQYKKKDIISPQIFTRGNSYWLYVNLPQGNPVTDFKSLVPAVFFSVSAATREPYPINKLLTGTILEKKLKAGVIQSGFKRGYFVETSIPNPIPGIIFITLGKKRNSVTNWSGIILANGAISLTDDMLEDI